MAKSEQVSGWFLLAMSGIPEWEDALYLCCSQHNRDTTSWPPLCHYFSLLPFPLPCSSCPAPADGFEPPVLQMGRSWSLLGPTLFSTVTRLSAQNQARLLVT